MTRLFRAALAAFALVGVGMACSSGSGGAVHGSAGSAGTQRCGDGTLGCRPWDCVCNDGAEVGGSSCRSGSCVPGAEVCAERCEDHGGVASFEPRQTVETSAECAAFCNRLRTECGADTECNVWFWCRVDSDECPESVRDYLGCQAENMQVQCLENGWSASPGGCSPRLELCDGTRDGGTD